MLLMTVAMAVTVAMTMTRVKIWIWIRIRIRIATVMIKMEIRLGSLMTRLCWKRLGAGFKSKMSIPSLLMLKWWISALELRWIRSSSSISIPNSRIQGEII